MRKQKAFTLIELLVVIAIIALLLSIIMPSLQKVKKQAQFIICGNNLKQFGISGTLYTTENDGKFPVAIECITLRPASYGTWRCRWHDEEMSNQNNPDLGGVMWPYLQDQSVALCPTFASLAKKRGRLHIDHDPSIPVIPQYSYAQNAWLGNLKEYEWPMNTGQHPYENETWIHSEMVTKVQQVTRASNIFMYSEENMEPLNSSSPDAPPGWTYNWSGDVLNDNGIFLWWGGPGSICDSVGSFHKTSWATFEKRAAGVANAVFVDGHLDTMYPWETQKKGSAKRKMGDLPH